MIELPEAITLTRQLDEAVTGKTIENVHAAQSPHGFAWYFGEPQNYPSMLNGRQVDGVNAYGGHVELRLGAMRLTFQDGVNVRLIAPGGKLPNKHQLLVEFTDGYAIVCTVQMYGAMMAFPEGALDDNFYYTVAKEKPSPLSQTFTFSRFESLNVNTKLSAKAFLATEQRIPGLGNGCVQDILFRAGVHPQRKMGTLLEEDRVRLYQSMRDTLFEMTQMGGRNTEKDLYGKPGGYRTLLSNKTLAFPCPRCGGGITRKAYLGGNVYFCADCQPIGN